jgi:4-coumarate--CoA ligase
LLQFLSLPAHDTHATSGYGLTETSPSTHIVNSEAFMTKVGSIGLLIANLEARIVIDDTVEAKEGEPGELWVRGPNVMKV